MKGRRALRIHESNQNRGRGPLLHDDIGFVGAGHARDGKNSCSFQGSLSEKPDRIDSDPERTTITRCGSPRYTTIRPFLVFLHAFHAAISITYWFAIAIAIDPVRLFR
ncbi:MAG: hypothetical protein BECKG1743E_GA0114224_101473 [Candidatus Kentron sp. G]|nr:MAG: hypothetical protein BECKG1743E_GA0114224_101473 [Candidatus Kentron sp. G]